MLCREGERKGEEEGRRGRGEEGKRGREKRKGEEEGERKGEEEGRRGREKRKERSEIHTFWGVVHGYHGHHDEYKTIVIVVTVLYRNETCAETLLNPSGREYMYLRA